MIVSEMYSKRHKTNKDKEIKNLKKEVQKQKLLAKFEANMVSVIKIVL